MSKSKTDYKALYLSALRDFCDAREQWAKERAELEKDACDEQDASFKLAVNLKECQAQLAARDAKIAALMACVRGLFGSGSVG